MNINNSGKIPDIIRKIAVVAGLLLVMSFASCHGLPENSPSSESEYSSSSDDQSTHVPVDDSSSGGDESSVGVYESSSAGVFESSDSSSEIPPKSSSDGESSLDSSEPESSGDISSSPESVGTSSVTPSQPNENSSSAVSSVTPIVPPDPPPVVVVPNFEVPTSPGTLCATDAKGVIDYSNASRGYVSAKYTGSRSRAKLIIKWNNQKEYPLNVSVNGTTDYFPLSNGSGEYTVTLYEINETTGRYSEVVSATISVKMESSLAPFLLSNAYSVFDQNSDCVYKAAEVCAGKTDDIEKIAAIFGWVTSNITYDYYLAETVQKGYMPDPEKTYHSRTGICFDYASLMCAMLRSQSIPTRLVDGYASPDIRHAWNEVYTEKTGWITPELLLKNAGYNIVDSTFYANSKDKSQISSYISNSANYQAVYYY